MIKIIEGTAEQIERKGNLLIDYKLESLQFTFRSLVYGNDGSVSSRKHSFYVAVFQHVAATTGGYNV